MANEIYHTYDSGNTFYTLIRRKTDDFVYDVAAGSDTFEAFNAANIANYDLPMTDDGGDFYSVDFPAGISAGSHRAVNYLQLAGAPATNDLPLFHGEIFWSGTAEEDISTITDLIETIKPSINQVHNVFGPGE